MNATMTTRLPASLLCGGALMAPLTSFAEVDGVWIGAVGDAGAPNVNEVKIANAAAQTLAGK